MLSPREARIAGFAYRAGCHGIPRMEMIEKLADVEATGFFDSPPAELIELAKAILRAETARDN